MTSTASVLYPRQADAKFDMDYYLKTHMPLVEKHWKPLGLEKWQVVDFEATDAAGDASPYVVGCYLTWTSKASQEAAAPSPGTAEIMGDIPNFTNIKPILVSGAITGSG